MSQHNKRSERIVVCGRFRPIPWYTQMQQYGNWHGPEYDRITLSQVPKQLKNGEMEYRRTNTETESGSYGAFYTEDAAYGLNDPRVRSPLSTNHNAAFSPTYQSTSIPAVDYKPPIPGQLSVNVSRDHVKVYRETGSVSPPSLKLNLPDVNKIGLQLVTNDGRHHDLWPGSGSGGPAKVIQLPDIQEFKLSMQSGDDVYRLRAKALPGVRFRN